ncbi:hypothetical protein [Phytohabitans rumicis]|uniref:hypothetical protein n=1 Tax=Phytohabitans rumicis TaxID=1076125 RepID=UPI001FE8C6E6|nr:hypothetical protein [Phytohabitans rumicis]
MTGRAGRALLSPIGKTKEATAAGIYGIIVGAAVMAASHAATAMAVVGAVLGTLVVYWSAERFARLMAERLHSGRRRPAWSQVRRQLTAGWEIVTASALPLLVLVALRLLGTDLGVAIDVALVCSTLLLWRAGWDMGRHGELALVERLAAATVAGLFGVVFIVLKMLLH